VVLPERFGRYELLHLLARGGMAEIFVARAPGVGGFEKLVVIKRILPEMTANHEFVGLFLDEARLAGTLHHSNIAQVFDAGLEGGRYFMAMEYVHGRDVGTILRSVAKRGESLPLAEALAIVTGVCAGLHYAHEQTQPDGRPLGLIHRDVSPSNVLVTYDGWPKLVDFGIAKAITRTVETQQGRIRGKAAYMSPEQVLGRPLDRRSDIFSLGIVLYEMTTMTRLFKRATDFDTMKQLVEHPAPPPGSRCPGYPTRLEEIVLKALSRDRDRRYQTAEELQSDLEEFARGEKLSLASAGLACLMGELFPDQVGVWELPREEAPDEGLDSSERLTPRDTDPLPSRVAAAAARPDPSDDVDLPAGSEVDDPPTEVTPSIFAATPAAAPPAGAAPPAAAASAPAAARYRLITRTASGVIDASRDGRSRASVPPPAPAEPAAHGPAPAEPAAHGPAPAATVRTPAAAAAPAPRAEPAVDPLVRVRALRAPGLASPLVWLLLVATTAAGGGLAWLATRPPPRQPASGPAAPEPPQIAVQVVSMPGGATVWIDGKRQPHSAPGTFRVPRSDRLALRLELEGYSPHQETLVVPPETGGVLLRAVLRPNAGDTFDGVDPSPASLPAARPASGPPARPDAAAAPASASAPARPR
jgi:serine/threonine protein kinase